MFIKVEPVSSFLGDNSKYDMVLGLSGGESVAPNFVDAASSQILANSFNPQQGEALPDRLKFILSRAFYHTDISWSTAPIILLLPQMHTQHGMHNNDELYRILFSHLCEAIVDLKNHPQCYLFPYGRSALILAWNKIISLMKEHEFVWVLAVDSDPRFRELEGSSESNSGLIANETVLLTKFIRSKNGLNCSWHSIEAQTRDKQPSVAVESLFNRFKRQGGEPVQQFYVPYLDHESGVTEWANVYSALHPYVGINTQIVMTGATVGELGASSSLYNFLSIYESYRSAKHAGVTLQLEASEKLYRALAFYTWH